MWPLSESNVASYFKSLTQKPAFRFIIPYFLVLLLLIAYPLYTNFYQSFQTESGLSLENYKNLFKNPLFFKILGNTGIWVAASVGLQFVIGLGLALLLNQPLKGRAIFRGIILVLPWATPDIVAAVAWKWMYNDMYGVFNDILVRLGLINTYLPWLGQPNLAKLAVIIANVWKGFPISAMLYLAALQTVPKDLYEAGSIDGVSTWQKFRFITLPLISPFILTTVMLTVMWTINYFPLIFTMTGGGPANATDTLVTFAYRKAFRFMDFSGSAALSTFTFLVILVFAVVYTRYLLREEEK
ncbi:carbohydrate ABC transporter permease [Candidatus Sordicultor fermentans]|uniref:carbohydrate ABC transporter permease n=1 Tax=Candidatus Sordicultor fermentans TaxID=1953203 RepID=UPI003908A4B6